MNVENLKKARSTVRRSVTDTIKIIENEIKKENEKSIGLIEEQLEKLLDKEKNLDKYDIEILNSCKDEEIEKEVEKQQEYKDNIITWKVRAKKALQKKETETEISLGRKFETRNVNQNTIKLPRLQIPQFDGNILKFKDFISQFDVAIHNNSNLSNVEKFNYLKSYLVNEAEVAIRNLALSSENYEIALQILHERFGRADIIRDAHMSKLLNLIPVRKSFDTISLRRLYSECETHIRGLENNGIKPENYSCLLFPVLLKAIPRDLSLEFSRRTHAKDESEISELLKFLKVEIQCRERNEHLIREFNSNELDSRGNNRVNSFDKPTPKYGKFTKNKVEYNSKNKFYPDASHTSAFAINVKKCVFCFNPEYDHDSINCPLSIEERKLSLRKNGMCYLCFQKAHIFRHCKSKNLCDLCNRRHHKLICEEAKNKNQSASEQTETLKPGVSPISNASVQSVMTSKILSCMSQADSQILLEACSAVIISESENKKINVMFDNGSQRCFILRKIANELKLNAIRQESLLVYTFGKVEPMMKIYDVVELMICNPRDNKKKIKIEALITDVITNTAFKVSTEQLKRNLRNKNYELANINELSGNDISLLIGAQYFWDIHTGRKQRINKSLYLLDTLFGTVVQGKLNSLDLNETRNVSAMKVECCKILNETLKQFWQLDSMGIIDTENERSVVDKEFISKFESNLKFTSGRYETKLFWEMKPQDLDNNFAIAKLRFDNLRNKMTENSWVYDEYKNIVKEHLNVNIVEECSSELTENAFYMPHSAVVRSDKDTTKVRLVFDASSKRKGCKSLNDCLSAGPALNPKILDVILQFREYEYAFSGDIQGAFLTIGIAEEDRNYLRFLWFPDKIDSNSYKILRMNSRTIWSNDKSIYPCRDHRTSHTKIQT